MSVRGVLSDIAEVLSRAGESVPTHEALRRAIGAAVDAAGLDAGWVRVHHARGDFEIASEGAAGMDDFCFARLEAPSCLCGEALACGRPMARLSVNSFCGARGFKSVAAVPIEVNDTVSGFLFLARKDTRPIDTEPFAPLARYLAIMTARLAATREMEKRLGTLHTVSRVGAIISSQLTLRELTQATDSASAGLASPRAPVSTPESPASSHCGPVSCQ